MSADTKKTARSKRTKLPRDSSKSKNFIKNWEKLSRSGKHDMNIIKEAMLLIIANDNPLPAEWNDHKLKGFSQEVRECHVKGDLLLVYRIFENENGGLVLFLNTGTHSEIFC